MSSTQTGLEGIVVAETELSDVDGDRGQLIVRGYAIEDLVGQVAFEDVCALLWSGGLPTAAERDDMRTGIASGRRDAFDLLPSLGNALALPDGMDALRAATGHLSSSGDFQRDAYRLTGGCAVFAAAWVRRQRHQEPIEPDASMSHAADYLHMMSGGPIASARVDALDAYLCCVVDHGLNASTLAARVVASTGSDLVSAVIAGIGALKGPLHGGAPGPCWICWTRSAFPDGRDRGWPGRLRPAGGSWGWGTVSTACAIHAPRRWNEPRRDWKRQEQQATGCRWHGPSSATPRRCSPSGIPSDNSGRTWSSTPPCCWRRSAFRARCSRRRLPCREWPAGAPTMTSNAGAGV